MAVIWITLQCNGSYIEIDSHLLFIELDDNKSQIFDTSFDFSKVDEFTIVMYVKDLSKIAAQIAIWHFESNTIHFDISNFGSMGHAMKIEVPNTTIKDIKKLKKIEDGVRVWDTIWEFKTDLNETAKGFVSLHHKPMKFAKAYSILEKDIFWTIRRNPKKGTYKITSPRFSGEARTIRTPIKVMLADILDEHFKLFLDVPNREEAIRELQNYYLGIDEADDFHLIQLKWITRKTKEGVQ